VTLGSTSTSQVQTDSRLRRILGQEGLSSIRPPLAWPLLDMVSLVVQNFSPHRLSKLRHTDSSDTHDLAPRVCGAWVETLPFLACHEMADKVLAPSIRTLATSMVSRGPGGVAPVYDALKAHELAISSIQSGIRSIKGGQSSDSSILAAAVTCLFLAEVRIAAYTGMGLKLTSLVASTDLRVGGGYTCQWRRRPVPDALPGVLQLRDRSSAFRRY
jgi:hypothetical protein